jgi:hypothetical protein
MVWWSMLDEIWLIIVYLSLIHVLSNLDLKLLNVSCAHDDGGGRGGRAHKEIIESKHFKIYLCNFSFLINY